MVEVEHPHSGILLVSKGAQDSDGEEGSCGR